MKGVKGFEKSLTKLLEKMTCIKLLRYCLFFPQQLLG